MLIKIFSYNIKGLPYISDFFTNQLADWFTNTDYDLICFQEVFTQSRIDILSNALSKIGYTILKPNDFKEWTNFLGSGLLTAIKNKDWSIISDTFITYNTRVGAEIITNKGFHSIELQHKASMEYVVVVNTHMQSENPSTYFGGCFDTRPIRKAQAQQIYDYFLTMPKTRHILIGDLNSEQESHDDILYLTGSKQGFNKHTFIPTGEDLDHVAILPKFWYGFVPPLLKDIAVLTKLNWSDHWPIHVIMFCETSIKR